MISHDEYGPLGLYVTVSISNVGDLHDRTGPVAPTPKQVSLAIAAFCIRGIPMDRWSSKSGIAYVQQRLVRGAWRHHPEAATFAAKREETGAPNAEYGIEPESEPPCPRCGRLAWERIDYVPSTGELGCTVVCCACGVEFHPYRLWDEIGVRGDDVDVN